MEWNVDVSVSERELKELKKKFFILLDTDEEFKYLVAGKLGYGEILKRFDDNDAKFNEILKNINEVRKIIEEHSEQFQALRKITEEHSEQFQALHEADTRLEKMISDVQKSTERMMLSLEEEAQSMVMYFLRINYGITITVPDLVKQDLELDIFGSSTELVILGEASVRIGKNKLEALVSKYKTVQKLYPELLRRHVLLILYGMKVMPEAVTKAEELNIWVLTDSKELTKMSFQTLKE
jgi:hypothetical protein